MTIFSMFRKRKLCFFTDFVCRQPIPFIISFERSLVNVDISSRIPNPIVMKLLSLSKEIRGVASGT